MESFRFRKTPWRRLAWSPVFGAALFAGLWLYAMAPYEIELPLSEDIVIEPQAERFRCLAVNCEGVPQPPPIEVLGNPAAARYPECHQAFARNPWDLVAHEGRLFIGLGDESNSGPSANAGPVPVLALDLSSGKFFQESILDEEQVERFYAEEDALWVPGADPRQSWRLGNLYRRGQESHWTKLRTLPQAIHTHALAWHNGALYAGLTATKVVPNGLGTERWGSAIARSSDGGSHWEFIPLGGLRLFEFIKVADHLYATDIFPEPAANTWLNKQGREGTHAPIYELLETGVFQRRLDLDALALFPDTPLAGLRSAIIDRAVSWGERAAYLGLFSALKDSAPVQSAYIAAHLDRGNIEVRRIPLPEKAVAFDLLTKGEQLFVLFSEPQATNDWVNEVWSSHDGHRWTSIIRFSAQNPARSFEKVGDDWYFGLGSLSPPKSDHCTLQDEVTGTLLRIHGSEPHTKSP